jgi:hypothetical protein
MNTLDQQMTNLIDDSGLATFGVRVMTRDYETKSKISVSVGDYIKNSYQWVDGISTGDELDGASCLPINYDGFDVEDIQDDIEDLKNYLGNGDNIVLVGGDSSYEGNDLLETVISNARILHIFN